MTFVRVQKYVEIIIKVENAFFMHILPSKAPCCCPEADAAALCCSLGGWPGTFLCGT
jgi:hypothetical protein